MYNAVSAKIQRGEKVLGTFLSMDSLPAIEALGQTGMDFVIVDTEHGPVGAEGALGYIRAAETAGLTPFVRVHEIARSAVLHALDAGAQGLIVPCVKTVDEVKRLIEYAKFAPLGNRGFCPTRDGRWGFADFAADMEGYMACCNRETLLLPQCETVECLGSIEPIVALPGVDGIFVGPYDLSIAMGMPGEFDHPDFKAAIARVLHACKAAGKQAHIFAGSVPAARERFAQGFEAVAYSLDAIVYIQAFKDIAAGVKA
mgnify:CR=1 FL=1